MSDSGERLQDALRSAGRRLTPQRRLILQVLEESDGHLDADELYDRVKVRDPDASLATVYRTLSPWWLFVPLGVFLLAFSVWAMRKSINGGFDRDTELFLYIIHPEKSFPIQGGMYQYVRHAHYAEGIWMAIGAAFLAQNWMGFLMAFMFLLPYYGIARAEDKELIRRHGASFETYVKSKPMFLPRLRDVGSLVRLVLSGS